MLTKETHRHIQAAINQAHNPPSGMFFDYSFSNYMAMTLPKHWRVQKLRNEQNIDFYPDEIQRIEEFFALGGFGSNLTGIEASEEAKAFTAKLLELFDKDFEGMPRTVLDSIDHHDRLDLLFINENHYHQISFDLFWS